MRVADTTFSKISLIIDICCSLRQHMSFLICLLMNPTLVLVSKSMLKITSSRPENVNRKKY